MQVTSLLQFGHKFIETGVWAKFMRTDKRYIAVKRMIQAGDITMLHQCFNIIPKSIVAEDLGEHKGRYSSRLNGIENMTYKDIKNLSSLFEITSI
jgi:hypothetical protein